jgi:hypothetical protein
MSGLLYDFDAGGANGVDIAFAQGRATSWPTGAALSISSIGIDEAPLPMPPSVDFTFLFDTEMSGRRYVYAASPGLMPGTWARGGYGDANSALNSAGNNYHVAARFVGAAGAAPNAVGRLWWITDRPGAMGAGTVRLVTAANLMDTVAVDVPTVQANGCHTGGDLEPWVVPDGSVLFFSSLIYVGTTCNDDGDGKRRLSYVPLDAMSGQPTGRAVAIGHHMTGYDDRAPSLTADLCTLLFATDRDGGTDLDIYAMPRN